MRLVHLVRAAIAASLVTSIASTAASLDEGAKASHQAAPPVSSAGPAQYHASGVATKTRAILIAPTATPARISLPAPSAKERSALQKKNAARLTGRSTPAKASPLVIGFARAIPPAQRTWVLADLAWLPLPDGSRAARIEIHSPRAAALRVSLALPASHPDLQFHFSGNGARAEVMGPYPANAIAAAAVRDGRFWSPVLEGDTAIIELHAGPDASIAGLAMTLGPASHLVVAGESLRSAGTKRASDIGDAGACNLDLACIEPSAALSQAANSVGKIVFNDRAGTTYLCTATLLNDSTTSFTPFLFTASHCYRDEGDDAGPALRAATTNVYWFFRAAECRSTAVPAYALQSDGAMLLARSDDYDWALLRLSGAPPAGVFFSAWRADALTEAVVATALHHPSGDLLKFSQGPTSGYQVFSDGSSFLRAQWNLGTTEQGSSGSALFTFFGAGNYYEVRGGLWGGEASCDNRDGVDYFSRLDNMLPLSRQYLTPDAANPAGQSVVIEYYHRGLDHYFITTEANEINLLDAGVLLRGWVRTGIRFLAYSTPQPGTNPVCRFYLKPEVGDSHFYSASPDECERVRTQFGDAWVFESASVFYIRLPSAGVCPAGTRPIWRFFNTLRTNHRYTPEVTTRDELRAHPSWVAEGDGPDTVTMCSPQSS